ncbi:hypothetical protein CLIB1423_26S00958 [[Candida] railenensis]|uniref:Peptide N-acetyl-beta-D-glucosaminyl asparaginase amidase A N-terminal domain-containing protein n=1 Tax=[Candida] railenensis TaxID=45579 RepID=A0A9P0QTN1_9ASCO|nr:hypothetical protein CLIB1423_26S00958 [[Candida] railenensis]
MRKTVFIFISCISCFKLVNSSGLNNLNSESSLEIIEIQSRSLESEENEIENNPSIGYDLEILNPSSNLPTPTISYVNSSSTTSSSPVISATSSLPITTSETIQVGYPYIPGIYYGDTPLVTELLLNHTFENSYGVPFTFTYKPPAGLEFNRVILTLNNSITNYQYDRLAHLSFNGAEIWRSSTIEPYGSKTVVKSSYNKDVSIYLKLFQEESFVRFDLGNIISSRLQGAPNIQVYISYYNVDLEDANDIPINVGGDSIDIAGRPSIFSTAKHASRVYPLTNITSDSESDVPLPENSIHVKLPTDIPRNTTRLILSIFASGNSNEEFWYSNTFQEYTNIFQDDGVKLYGYGPGRLVEVYYNSQKVATQSPQPFIFTGGFSPDLWIPIVANDAFDLPSIDIDLTALLPEVWGDSGYIDILVTNGTSESSSSIGSNWLVSANLLTFEDESVYFGNGSVLAITNTSVVDTRAEAATPGALDQSFFGVYQASISSEITFELKNGSIIQSIIQSDTYASISNIQALRNYSSTQSIDHLGNSSRSVIITTFDDVVLFEHNSTYGYPLQISYSSFNDSNSNGWSAISNVNVNITKLIGIFIDGSLAYDSQLLEVSSSLFEQTAKEGNHGNGSSTAHYSVQQYDPFTPFSYNRNVQSTDNKLTGDTSNGGLN